MNIRKRYRKSAAKLQRKEDIRAKQFAKLAEYVRLRHGGFSYADIGGAFHITGQAVYQFIKRHQ